MDIQAITSRLKQLFVSAFALREATDVNVCQLPQAGSDRLYFLMECGRLSAVGTYSPDAAEGKCFVGLARSFRRSGCAVPEIFAHSPDCRFYLQQNLGNSSLFSLLQSAEAPPLLEKTIRELVRLQKTPPAEWTANVIHKPFGIRQAKWDLNYFKYEYLKQRNVIFDEDALEDDFERLSERLCNVAPEFSGFMMRDCQSRNVMVSEGNPYFIDFQGGRRGPVVYDIVSFLWQARAGFSQRFRMEMLDCYADVFCGDNPGAKRKLLSMTDDFVLFRTLQVLGAYGYRGLVQHRAHFVLSIPGALANLRALIEKDALAPYPELEAVCLKLANDPSFMPAASPSVLRVEVFSFSYKKGYPEDLSGNGGGFAFDCRALHNPGRYAEHKSLTGRDLPVREFLEKRGEVKGFLRGVWALVDPAVERYLQRGFSNLQIGFGCTGGQHRSVYCAEATAAHLKSLFPEAEIVTVHREHPSD